MIQLSTKDYIYILTVTVLLFIGINRLLFMTSSSIEQFSSLIIYPSLIMQKKIVEPVKAWFKDINPDVKELRAQLDEFKQKNEKLRAKIIKFTSLKHYAQSVKPLTDFLKRYKTENAILGQVILKNLDDQNHFILLDVGSTKGVKPDMSVIYQNCLVGRVTEVYPFYSKALLITDKQCKIAAYCASNKVQGIHVGQNDSRETKLDFVNHLETVNPNDLIIASGEGTVFPRGFGIGTVKDIKKDDLNLTVIVKPFIDIDALSYCHIIQKGSEFMQIEEPKQAPEKEIQDNLQLNSNQDLKDKENLHNE